MTIILTIHQPRACIWDLFDHVVIMNCQEKPIKKERKQRNFSSSSFRSRGGRPESASAREDVTFEREPGTVVAEGDPEKIDWLLRFHNLPCDVYDNIPDHFMDKMKQEKDFHNQLLRLHLGNNNNTQGQIKRKPRNGSRSKINRLVSEAATTEDFNGKVALPQDGSATPSNRVGALRGRDLLEEEAFEEPINLPQRGATIHRNGSEGIGGRGHMKTTTLGFGGEG